MYHAAQLFQGTSPLREELAVAEICVEDIPTLLTPRHRRQNVLGIMMLRGTQNRTGAQRDRSVFRTPELTGLEKKAFQLLHILLVNE